MKIGRIEIKTAKLEKPDFGIFLNERKTNGDKQHEFNFGKLIIKVIIHKYMEKERMPKIKGWIARDLCGTVNLHSKKPVWKEDFQMWECGEDFYPIEDCLEENTMFPELNYYDDPIEVEITIKQC